MIAPSNSLLSTSRRTRIERSASWKTIAGALTSAGASLDDLVQLPQVGDVALEVGLAGALGGGADDHAALARVDVLEQLALALALRLGQPAAGPHPGALWHVDEIAAGDRELHREPRPLGLQRVLDHLDQDLLAGLDQLVDSPALAAPAPGRRLAARKDDLVHVQEAVSLQADVHEGGLHAREDVVDHPLVDVADDRPLAAALDVELGDLPVAVTDAQRPRLRLRALRGCGAGRRAALPAARPRRALALEHRDAGLAGVD